MIIITLATVVIIVTVINKNDKGNVKEMIKK